MNTFDLTVASYDSVLYHGDAVALVVATPEGELGIEPHHEPLLALIKEDSDLGLVTADVTERTIHVRGGLLSFRDNRCTVTVDTADSTVAPGRRRQDDSGSTGAHDQSTLL